MGCFASKVGYARRRRALWAWCGSAVGVGGGWFRERITSYDPPYEFGYLVERSFPPSRHEGGKLTFTEVSGGTRVMWTTTAEVRLPFAAAITRAVVRPGVTYIFGKVLDAAAAELTKS
ncbi:SRPBCC family protein [Nocardia sp. NPDC051756]|uniref:SRPBCC family protein n=1 Tax=Nocardia sp. NPDC051756 TaxID=3154751 RepID=UPI0034478C5F